MSHQRTRKPWEKPSGSFTKNVAPALTTTAAYEEEESLQQPARDPIAALVIN